MAVWVEEEGSVERGGFVAGKGYRQRNASAREANRAWQREDRRETPSLQPLTPVRRSRG